MIEKFLLCFVFKFKTDGILFLVALLFPGQVVLELSLLSSVLICIRSFRLSSLNEESKSKAT